MLPLLIVLGATGALLEFKRLVGKPPKESDLFRLRQSEEKLKRVLHEVQKELQQEKSEHERDHTRAEELERVAEELRTAQAELARKGRDLEQKAIGLADENTGLHKMVDDLQAQHAEELRRNNEMFEAELDALKREVASAFEAFTEGDITAEGLVEKLTGLGVDVELTTDELRALPEAISHDSGKVQQVELQVDANWRSHLRLLTDDPERMARQLAESAHRAALPAASRSASSGVFPTVKTPPKERKDASLFGSVPALAMAMFTPRTNVEKENRGDSPMLLPAKAADKEPLKSLAQPTEAANSCAPPSAKKVVVQPPTPTRKKSQAVPRLGLSVVLRGDQSRNSREAFALGDLSIEDDQHMLNRSIMRS